jgi:predicted enzyme related to lactoylglutathione lyase
VITTIAGVPTLDKSPPGSYIAGMITNIKFISIPVRDQNRAVEFYTQKMGFKITTDQQFGPNQRWIEMKVGRGETGVVLFTPPGQEDRVGTFMPMSYQCDNVQKTYEELKARGVEFVQEPKTESWGTSAIFKDSEGNQFVLGTK